MTQKTYNIQIFASFLGFLNYLQYICTKKRRKDKNGQEIHTTFKRRDACCSASISGKAA